MKKRIFTLLLCMIGMIGANAQIIDSSFTTNGFLPYGGPLSNYYLNDHGGNVTILQPDGKLVVAEDYTGASADLYLHTYRYNADGTPDTTFGAHGVASVFCGAETDNRDVVLQADGKIVVAGATRYCILGVCGALQFIMMRLNTNGSLDSSFGNDGKILTTDVFGATGLYALPSTLKILADGKFIVGGRGPGAHPFVARLNNNGFPDNTFATEGVYTDTTSFTLYDDLAINAAGDILVLLEKYNGLGPAADTTNLIDNYIFKLKATGVRDNTFGTDGGFVFSVSNADHPRSIAIRNNQSIVVVGDEQFNNINNYDWAGTGTSGYGFTNKGYVAFVNANGTMSTCVPGGHKSINIPADTSTFFQKVLVLDDNRLFISGRIIRPYEGNFQEKAILTQIDSNANFITDFHTNGYWVFDYGISSTTDWPGRICSFYNMAVTSTHEVYATGRRNHIAGNTGTCLFLMKIKDLPTDSVIPSGVSAVSNKAILSLYPNPVQGIFSVEAVDNTTYTIYNADGRTVSVGNLTKGRNSIQLPSSAVSGTYFITDDKTGQIIKFVKK